MVIKEVCILKKDAKNVIVKNLLEPQKEVKIKNLANLEMIEESKEKNN